MSSAAVNIGTLFILVHFIGMYYLTASVCSYIISIGFGFALQKFWAFRDHSLINWHFQFARFATIALTNLAINTGLIYIFVDKLHLWYILAQVIAAALIAVESYFSYRFLVFGVSGQPRSHSFPPAVE